MGRLSVCCIVAAVGACRPSPTESSATGSASAGSNGVVESSSGASDHPKIGGAGYNVLFISMDTTRADALGCYGGHDSKTPNIDRLAAEGTRFATCVAAAPLTLPSHSTIMTGAYTFVHGARDNGVFVLNPANTTLAEIFKKHGYVTHAEVAAGVLNAQYGLNQGFDTYEDLGERKIDEPKLRVLKLSNSPMSLNEPANQKFDMTPDMPEAETDRKANDITESGIAALRELAAEKKPFFLFLHYFDPHWPWEAPERFKGFKHPYFAEVAYVDEELGKLFDALKSLGLGDKTLVVLVSDHGEGRGQHGEMTHSSFVYDTTLLVPMIFWCPGQVPAGKVVEHQVRLIDVAPTVLSFVGLSDERTEEMSGVDLLPMLFDEGPKQELVAYSETIVPETMYGYSPLRSLRTEKWKYILAPKPELYDITTDPLELFNLAEVDADVASEMKERMRDLIGDAPRSPSGTRGTPKTTTDVERRLMESLGYVVSVGGTAAEFSSSSNELDNFEPKGENPKDHVETIDLIATGLGCFRCGFYEQSIPIWQRYVELEPDSPTGYSHLGTAYMAVGRNDDAIEMLRRTVELRPDAAEEHRHLGTLLLMNEDYDGALEHFQKAIEYRPTDVVAHLNLSKVLMHREDFDGALAAIEKGLEIRNDEPRLYLQKGRVLRAAGHYEDAVTSLEEALRLDPTLERAHMQLAGTLVQLDRTDDAIAHLKKAIEDQPDEVSYYQGLAECYAAKGDFEQAQTCFERIVELAPDQPEPHNSSAATLVGLGRLDEAIDEYKKVLDIDPKNALAIAELPAVLLKADRRDEAHRACDAGLAAAPQEPAVYGRIAGVLFALHDVPAAINALRAGRELAPDHPVLANDLAWTLATCDDPAYRNGAEAVEISEHAVSVTRAMNPTVLDTLAAALAEVGRFDDALDAADRAISLARRLDDPAFVARIEKRRALYAEHEPYREVPGTPTPEPAPTVTSAPTTAPADATH